MPSLVSVPRVVGFFFFCDLALAFLYLTDWGLGRPREWLTRFVDLEREGNLPTWYSSMQLLFVAILLALFASKRFARKEPAAWLLPVLPAVFALMSLDEVAQIHEKIGSTIDPLVLSVERRESALPETGAWMFVIGIPFFLVMLLLFSRVRRYFLGERQIFQKFVLALCFFAGSAAGLETLANFAVADQMANILQVCSEELGEMLGATTFLWASYDLLRQEGFAWNPSEAP